MTNNPKTTFQSTPYKFDAVHAVVATLYALFITLALLGMALQSLVVLIVGASLFALLAVCVFLPDLIVTSVQYNKFKKLTKAVDRKDKQYRQHNQCFITSLVMDITHLVLAVTIVFSMVNVYVKHWLDWVYTIVYVMWIVVYAINYINVKKYSACRKQSLLYAQSIEQTTAMDRVDTMQG